MAQPISLHENSTPAGGAGFKTANTLYEAGKSPGASAELRQALRHDISYAAARINIGAVLRQTEDFSEVK